MPDHHPQAALPRIAILATGGTIAGTGASSTATIGYTAATVGVAQLIAALPELHTVAQVSGEQVFQLASENIGDADWLALARRVNALLASGEVDGVVISHGTDTIEETAYFLNLVVKSARPVVLVGAMRPSTAMSADGPSNLYNAVLLAASREAVGKGVLVALNNQINAARDVTKTNTSTPDAFKTPELGVLGYMHDNRPFFYRQCTRRHTADSEFDVAALETLPQVEIIYGYANMNRIALDAFVAAGARGIIHAGVGDGSIASRVKPGLVEARGKGCVIVRASRVGQGIVARNGVADDDALDFVVADTLSPQKARILLMLALTVSADTGEIQRMFHTY
ncbi:type II asparaginase [Janthinobacterium sp.]|uniref:type II asparaginase n=1 Tax=Janthinobacterium sp. TaxID=1871054 RepID=UPI00293D9A34|nr:type II asparaginase [Janthinobacterium sp.]